MTRLADIVRGYFPVGLAAGGLMWLVWAISSILGVGCLDVNGQVVGTDHTAFHTAAMLLDEGRGDALYAFPELTEFARKQEELTEKPDFLDPCRNPPFYVQLYRLTTGLPYLASFGAWAVVGLLTLVAALAIVRGSKIGKPLVWSLSFYPVFATVSFGQNTLLSLGAFSLIYRCLVKDRLFLAGMAAGLLLFKPQLLLGLGVWCLLDFRRLWPCMLGFISSASFLALVSWLSVPDESLEWIRQLPDIARYDRFEFYNLHNPRGFGFLLTGNRVIGDVFGVVGLVLSVAWLIRFWIRFGNDRALMFGAAVFATLWGSPHTMIYEWALAVLPALVLWDHRPQSRSTWTCLFALAWVVLFVSTPVTKGQLALLGVALQLSVPALAIVALAAERELMKER
jgi:hypothetical protein